MTRSFFASIDLRWGYVLTRRIGNSGAIPMLALGGSLRDRFRTLTCGLAEKLAVPHCAMDFNNQTNVVYVGDCGTGASRFTVMRG